MKTKLLRLTSALLSLVVLLAACAPQPVAPTAESPTAAPVAAEQPHQVKGTYTVTDDHALKTYDVEHAVLLADMRGFVTRDPNWELPLEAQTLGFMTFDAETLSGVFELNLPVQPKGAFNDVNFDGSEDKGVQVFALSYQPNLAGGPFAESADRAQGWLTYLTSAVTDSTKSDEVVGGKLIIWSPDADQQFPTGFGADGLLFTDDDPSSSVPAGYSLVDLDKQPFEFSQTPTFEVTLNEPKEIEPKDFSNLSYTEAFDKTFEFVKLNYAFNGVAGKDPDWDKLYKELKPRVEEAEKSKDAMAFYLAIRDFNWALKDTHAYLDGGASGNDDFQKYVSGGYGFTVRELDDGRAIVIFVMEGGPAARAGMKFGAEVTQFNGKPISAAISEAVPYMSVSSASYYRFQQARYFTRGQLGQTAEVTFANPNEQPKTVAILPETEYESLDRAYVLYGVEQPLQPVTYKIIKEGNVSIGYVAINSYDDDLNLTLRLFERALQKFTEQKVMGVVIDMRYNSGGSPLGLAGFLSDKEILLGQRETYNQVTGKFEADGARNKILPMANQYRFNKMVTLVGLACADTCEEEAYAFSQVPEMAVMGQYPTAGAFATTKRGQIFLPEGISLQIPTERFTLPDGSLFLEGTGVTPTVKVPLDETTVVAENDVVLDAAVERVLTPDGIGIQPSAPPKMTPFENSDAVLYAVYLKDRAREEYSYVTATSPGTLKYTIALPESENLAWASYWCTSTKEILEQNLSSLQWKFTLDGKEIPLAEFSMFNFPAGASQCFVYAAQLDEWTAGEHHLSTVFTITQDINDGMTDYKAGDYINNYTVYVKP